MFKPQVRDWIDATEVRSKPWTGSAFVALEEEADMAREAVVEATRHVGLWQRLLDGAAPGGRVDRWSVELFSC